MFLWRPRDNLAAADLKGSTNFLIAYWNKSINHHLPVYSRKALADLHIGDLLQPEETDSLPGTVLNGCYLFFYIVIVIVLK